jgi:[ribosomal protein S5]-alanine N-acetyltransferase
MFKRGNIILSKLQREDLHLLLDLKSESWHTTHRTAILNMDDQVRWFESLDMDAHSPTNLVLMAQKCDFTKIGIFKIFGVDYVNRSADVAWDLFQEHRGQGFGKPLVFAGTSFCFQMLNLWRLNCEILAINVASQKCAEASAYKKEGFKAESVFREGEYIDSLIYGLTAKEFGALLSKQMPV